MIVSHISELAGRHRMNIQDIARAAGISYPSAHRLYHDRAERFDKRTLDALCRVFRCQPGDLFTYAPDEGQTPGPADTMTGYERAREG